jgi:hypothetical protein
VLCAIDRFFQRVYPDDKASTGKKIEGAKRQKAESEGIIETGKNWRSCQEDG